MARTWPVTRGKKALFSAFDSIVGPIASVAMRKHPDEHQDVAKILVLELWHMGDVVLSTVALQSLRAMYPSAKITLLAKPHAVELLEGSGLVDEIVTFDFPWTAMTGKYDVSRYDRDAISRLVRSLRDQHFDLSIDCRMDLRSNVLTKSIGAARRVGYDFGGGGFLLTDALPAPPADQHKVDDWKGLLAPLREVHALRVNDDIEPKLTVSDGERAEARRLLESHDIAAGDLVLGVHPGGSHQAKRWSEDNFAEVARTVAGNHGAKVVIFVDPDGCGSDMNAGSDAVVVRTSVREMMGLFTQCDLLLCNDSGPMHIAAALGVPVVAVFRTGSPGAYGPRGLNHTVVGEGAPWGQVSDIPLDDVLTAVESSLSVIRANSIQNGEIRA